MNVYSIKLQQFEGPLDLLLQLIEQEKLSINEISLATIAEQYLEYLQRIEQRFPEELADFLVVATKLLLIKSRTLLPYLQPEDEEEEGNLEEQLKIYKVYFDATLLIDRQLRASVRLYSRPEARMMSREIVFAPPIGLTPAHLRMWMEGVLQSLEPLIALPKQSMERAITLQEKIADLEHRLVNEFSLSFKSLVKHAQSRTEIILTFLALLELVKQRSITVKQDQLFSDIAIEKYNASKHVS